MNARILALMAGGLLCASAWAVPGEKAGAYGGGTSGDATEVTIENADTDGDGTVNREEARRLGIENFEALDADQNGTLDEQELAAVESQGQMNTGTRSKDEASTQADAPSTATAGEKAGAYGGGTRGDATEVTLENADTDGDGTVNRQEARRVGIERFDAVDRNQDGVLDEAEMAALETPGQRSAPSQNDADAKQGDSEASRPTPRNEKTKP